MRAIPAGDDPARHLRQMAAAFVRFALENPDHYRLFTTPVSGEAEPDALPSTEAARELVKGALRALAREGALATHDVDAAFEVTWAMLHGLISLRLIRPAYPFSHDLVDLALDSIEKGLLRRHPR